MNLKKFSIAFLLAAGLVLPAGAYLFSQAESEHPLYLDPSQPIDVRVEDLISRMTLKEKAGQLNMPAVYVEQLGKTAPEKMEACRRFAAGTYNPEIGPGCGFFALANTMLDQGARQQAEYFNELQKIALTQTRLKIPLMNDEEGTHGAMFPGGTVFPEGLAIGSTFDMDLVKAIYAADAQETRAVGAHIISTLVLELDRDPRMGRNEEAYTEDPYLGSRIAENIVWGAQGTNLNAPDKVIALMTDFPTQSEPVSGLERGAIELSERYIREIILPPWIAAFRAGALGVMAGYPEVEDVPVHASEKWLTKILRDELGFDGVVESEGDGFESLIYEKIATTQKEAGAMALKAGVDLDITYEPAYMGPLIQNVEEGRVPMSLVDRALRRVLTQKFRLGLFEHPYVDVERAVQVVHSEENQQLALRTAQEGIVLLKNEKNLLPLAKSLKSIAVIGPNADEPRNQLGDYSPRLVLQHVVTPLEGLKAKAAPGTKVVYARGCGVVGDDQSGFKEAVAAARQAQVAVVFVGEKDTRDQDHPENDRPTDGEAFDAATLELTGVQEDLIKAVAATGTPTVVVLINGRPLAIRWTAEHIPAILEAWNPGEKGGTAIADVLFGDVNPSGHLAITVPRHAGQLPVYYNYKPSKAYWIQHGWGTPYVDMPPTPLYPFGFGLSYTQFEYSNLRIEPGAIHPAGQTRISVDVKNTGERAGTEVAQLYIHDVVGSVSTPVKQLRGFQRVTLQPGETKTVTFTLGPEDLMLLNRDMHWVVEPGAFEIMVGSSSEDIRLKGTLDVNE